MAPMRLLYDWTPNQVDEIPLRRLIAIFDSLQDDADQKQKIFGVGAMNSG